MSVNVSLMHQMHISQVSSTCLPQPKFVSAEAFRVNMWALTHRNDKVENKAIPGSFQSCS
jgi:hypothetical protein